MTYEELNNQIRLLGEEKCLRFFPHCIAAMRYREEVSERLKQIRQ